MPRARVFALAAACLAAALPGSRAAPPPEAISPGARPFPLSDVRLLDGPFREAMLRDQQALLALDTDRLLHTFRLNAGLPTAAAPLGGWEAPEVELRGHTLGHFLSASALMYAGTGDARFKERADAVVAELAKIQDALGPRFHPGYLSAFPEEFFDRLEKREKHVWAPYYTIHKIMAGLLDVHQLCGNAQALDVLVKQAAWVGRRMDALTDAQRQAALETEFGGMGEVLANLHAVTGDPGHLRLARLFDHRAVFDPLDRGQDALDGLHANTQIPKAIAAAREYELTGEARYRRIASFFWRRVALQRSFAIGGHSNAEHFFPVDDFANNLGSDSTETCNTYNMLKLTRHLFAWAPDALYMDFYERALVNHILASQDPATGGVTYYCPLKPGAFKTYSKPETSFWCCVGTGFENHAKYADSVYFHAPGTLWVNLFVASELRWREQGLVVRQETPFPDGDTVRLVFTPEKPLRLAVKVRRPAWASSSGVTLAVNGRRQPVTAQPGSYITIARTWKAGDTVDLRLPMRVHDEMLPGAPGTVAFLYGPLVLAGDLGREGLTDALRYGPSHPYLLKVKPVAVPALVAADPSRIRDQVVPVPDAPLTFRTQGLARPADVTLVPFWKAAGQRYTVYWNVMSPREWQARRTGAEAKAEARSARAAATVDRVDVDDAASETAHAYRAEGARDWTFEGRKCREVQKGFLSYELKVRPDRPMRVFFTYLGTEGPPREVDVLVDGQTVGTRAAEKVTTRLLEADYAVPEALTRGKERVTVRFQTHGTTAAPAVFEVLSVDDSRR